MNNLFPTVNTERMYSVISATYNVEKYLDNYFKSLSKQSLDFERHIHLFLVDDGSTDNSAAIIKKWQNRYPKNIHYIKKENGGQSSARNLGLEHVKTKWVTFIDPDDFINQRYFEKVDQTITKYQEADLAMIGCNIQYYFEKLKLYLNRHPLKYRFDSNNSLCPVKDLNKNIQLSASTAFFRTDLIKTTQLKFDTRIKPNFEDAHFVNTYLIENHLSSVFFLKDAKYYYRRRKIKSSTLDTAWKKKELFDDVLRYGCLDLFIKADKTLGYVPKYLQRTILYHLAWYYKYLIDHNEKILFLSHEEDAAFHSLLEKLFEYIDIDTIEKFDLVGMGIFEKTAWVYLYKKVQFPYRTIFVNKDRKNLYFNYYAYTPGNIYIEVDGKEIEISKVSQKEHMFVNKRFITEFNFEIQMPKNKKLIFIEMDSSETYVESSEEIFLNEIPIKHIKTLTVSHIKNVIHNLIHKFLLE